jgi:hypothetical protein
VGHDLSPDGKNTTDNEHDYSDNDCYPAACLERTELRASGPTLEELSGILAAGYGFEIMFFFAFTPE